MTDESYLLDKKEKNWLSRLLKVIFFICAFILIGITVLSNMGGSSDDLKSAVERFASDLFDGRPVVVNKLVHMSFFPRIGFDVEGINILSTSEGGHIIAHADKVQAFMTFWNVATQTPKFTNLYIENFTAIKGAMGAKEFHIEKVFIDHDVETATAKLRGNGRIGIHPWSFVIEMDVLGSNGRYNYMLRQRFPLIMDIADIHFESIFINHESDYYKLEDFELSSGGKMIRGNLILSALGEKLLKLKGRIEMSDGRSIISPDVIFDYAQSPVKVSGDIISDGLLYKDVMGENSVFSILMRLRETTGYGDMSKGKASFIGQYNLDVDFDLKNVTIEGTLFKNLKFPVTQTDVGIKFGPVKSDVEIMPPLLFVVQKKTGHIISVLQEGTFDLPFFKNWLEHVPKKLDDHLDIECGFASFAHDGDDLTIEDFAINVAQGSIHVRNSKIESNQNVGDLKFYVSAKKADFKVIELETEAYDFVQASLQSSTEISSCASYITQIADNDEMIVEESDEEQE